MNKITLIGIDTAKQVFHLVGALQARWGMVMARHRGCDPLLQVCLLGVGALRKHDGGW